MRPVFNWLVLFCLALILAAPGAVWAAPAKKANNPFETPAVTVRGKTIFLAEINNPNIYKARQELFRLEGDALRERVLDELRQALPGEFPKPKVVIHPKEIDELYDQAGLNQRGSLETFRDQIIEFLTRRKTADFNTTQFEKAVAKGYVKSHHQPPPVFLVSLPQVHRKNFRGPENAPVQMVEFSDFQCPFCRRVLPTLEALHEKYGNKLRRTFRHLPLSSIHKEARAGAEAAECAGDQGRFWPYHDALFLDPKKMTSKDLRNWARMAKVPDLGAFNTCISQRRHAARVDEDLAAAHKLGMSGTPSFLIGRAKGKNMVEGVVLSGALPLEKFSEVIDQFLANEMR